MDDWTREPSGGLAGDLVGRAVYPFDMDPPLPFLTWARRGGAGHVSPLGLNIHPTYGLWHAYRAALLFPVAFDMPPQSPGAHPCETCADKPCLSACPVSAFDGTRYDVRGLCRHICKRRGRGLHVAAAALRAMPARWDKASPMLRHRRNSTCGRFSPRGKKA